MITRIIIVLISVVLTSFVFASHANAMTKNDLIEKITDRTGLTREDLAGMELEELEGEPNSCTPKSVSEDLQKIVVLCLGSNQHSAGHAKKPKEIVVVGSKVFALPTGFFIEN
jgi:hypothetical protein